MPWVKLDDRFPAHRKIRKAWKADRGAVGLWAMALAHVNEALQDGFVDPEWIEDQLPNARERAAMTGTLVEAGLWEPFGDGWMIHDFADYQPSSAHIAKVREARRLAGVLGGKASGASRRNGDGT
jgi:hypothetical protein